MATVQPFRALRPSPEKAAAVSAVPYDVVSTSEARQLAEGNPLSFLHVSRAEIDLADGTNPYSDAVYAKAAENLAKLKLEAPLTLESEPSLYVYRLRMGDHEQTGIAGCCSLDEYDSDVIRKHERTRPDKEDDRTRHMLTLNAQTGPVFLTYRGREEIDAIVEEVKRAEPLFDFTAPDGVAHALWRIGGQAAGRLAEKFLEALREQFSVRPDASPSPARRGEISIYLAGRWYGLVIPPGGAATGGAISSLDAALLQEKILEPLLGIKDIRTDKRVDFIGGIRGTQELERLVDSGKFAVAFSLFPVSLDDLMAVSDANEIMPPKSTWFEPKLRDGLLIHEI